MLPSRPHSVKTGTVLSARSQRARRNRLVVLGVLSAHAWLLGLLWNGKSSRPPDSRPALIEVSVLAPSAGPDQALIKHHPAPAADGHHRATPVPASHPTAPKAAGRPPPLPPAASANSRTSPPVPASAVQAPQGVTPGAVQVAGAAAPTHSALTTGPADGNGQKSAAGQASNPATARIELPDSSAGYLDNPRPAYPPLSRRLGEQGRVVLRVWVEADGRPGRIELKSGSGFERLDRAAQQAVQRWRFVPGKRAGMPDAMWVEVPLQFTLE